MARINDNIRSKRLKKQASSAELTEMAKKSRKAEMNTSGELIMTSEIKEAIEQASDPSVLINDPALFNQAKFYLKQLEDLREEIEEIHAYIVDAFGKDSTAAASVGGKGDKGDKGDPGTNGADGTAGAKGDKGNPGTDGTNGSKGDKGDKGNPGTNGTNGTNGAKGDKGNPGTNGTDGTNGSKGDKGDKGDKGNTGDTLAVSNNSNDRIITATGGSSVNAESTLTYNGSRLRTPEVTSNRYFQNPSGIPTNNLGDPTVTEMALFESQFSNKTGLNNSYDDLKYLLFYIQANEESEWKEVEVSDDQKRRFLRTNNSNVAIPTGTYKFRVEFKGRYYTFANAMYCYWSSQSHNSTVHVWKKRCSDQKWIQHTSSTSRVSSWPGHLYLPFSTIPWHETNTTSTGHYTHVRIEFTPNYSTGNYQERPLALYGMQIWGGYPAGRKTQHYYDHNGRLNITKEADVKGILLSNGNKVIENGNWVGNNSGLVGPKGDKGDTGAAGSNGTNGAKGDKGDAGAAGTNGSNGSNGAKGDKGDTGSAGARGPAGTDGAAGAKGDKGDAGARGTAGTDGSDGARGPAGTDGSDGARGPAGAAGSDGSDGARGPAGAKGDAGAAGARGPAGSAGAKGDTGAAGLTGARGPAGANGTNGAAGAAGARGPAGAKGDTGARGPAGNDAKLDGTSQEITVSTGKATINLVFENGLLISAK